jgi:DNA-binding NarL/FixJ family response regulator
VRQALAAGVDGCLLKSDPISEYRAAIQALNDKRRFYGSSVATMVVEASMPTRAGQRNGIGCASATSNATGISHSSGTGALTPRERDVVRLLAQGKRTRETANTLGISERTAATHRTNIMRKLGVHSVGELVLYAIRNRMVSP